MGLIASLFNRIDDRRPHDSSLGAMLRGPHARSFDSWLFQWSRWGASTPRNSVESATIFGELGAAKSTGLAAWVLTKYLSIGMGALVCCGKLGGRELIETYANQAGSSLSPLVVSPGNRRRCFLIPYRLLRMCVVDIRVDVIVAPLMTIVERAKRGERAGTGQGHRGPIWHTKSGKAISAKFFPELCTGDLSIRFFCTTGCGVVAFATTTFCGQNGRY